MGLEGYINDYGIGNMAGALADRASSRTHRERYREESTYFLSRAQGYVRLFDQRVGFFQGKSASGDWTTPPDKFDPRVWRQGGDYTETDGWNFAFHAPQDGRGLADLYGGRAQLAAKLDQFFATPETAKFPGTYGGTIHEMLEARDVRLGQWGVFDIPAGVAGGKLTLEIGNEYLVSVSSDDQTYREVLRETSEEHDLNNLNPPHELDLNTLLGAAGRCTCASATASRRTAGEVARPPEA